MKLFLAISMFFLFLINIGCNATEPVIEDNTPAGSRDYEWTVDTLKTIETLGINRIWGYSPNDIWAVGSSSSVFTTIWHFDGTKWLSDSVSVGATPWAISGFSSNEVWLGTNIGQIWKYDGTSWKLFKSYSIPGYNNLVFQNFYKSNSNQLVAVGYAENSNTYIGVIMIYDGKNWNLQKIPDTKVSFTNVRIESSTNVLVLQGYTEGEGGKLITWDGKNLTEIYNGDYPSVSNIGDQIIVTIGQKIFKYNDGKLMLWYDQTGSIYYGKVWGGRSLKDFFWNSTEGIVHFNGIDFKTLFATNPENFIGTAGAVIFEKDIFFLLGYLDYKETNIIIHGKLIEGDD